MIKGSVYSKVLTILETLFKALLFLLPLRACPALAAPTLDHVNSFAYQLQNPDIGELAASPYDLLIIDYSRDGTQEKAFSASEISYLKAARKTVLAYLSIGEAEEYRYYFRNVWIRNAISAPCGKRRSRSAPEWLDNSNPDWCGNYKVRYWNEDWRSIIWGKRTGKNRSYLDRIIEAGFDGVYLDIVDAYEYWMEKPKSKRRADAAKDMAQFVIRLARYARNKRGQTGFIVVPQNGAGIVDELSDALKTRYLDSIQGIGAEDSFFYGDLDEDNEFNPQAEALEMLKSYLLVGKRVLAIDYLLDSSKAAQFRTLACEAGFIPQVSSRALDNLATHTLQGCL